MTMYAEFMNNQEQWETSQSYASLSKAQTMMLFKGTGRNR